MGGIPNEMAADDAAMVEWQRGDEWSMKGQ